MSDTPRADMARHWSEGPTAYVVDAELARTLERELGDAHLNKNIQRQRAENAERELAEGRSTASSCARITAGQHRASVTRPRPCRARAGEARKALVWLWLQLCAACDIGAIPKPDVPRDVANAVSSPRPRREGAEDMTRPRNPRWPGARRDPDPGDPAEGVRSATEEAAQLDEREATMRRETLVCDKCGQAVRPNRCRGRSGQRRGLGGPAPAGESATPSAPAWSPCAWSSLTRSPRRCG